MQTKITVPFLISILAVALTLGYFMVTQAAADIQQITICVNSVGNLRLKGGLLGNCKKNETELSWNKQGLQGEKGEKGDQGIQGEKGEAGASAQHGAGNVAFIFGDNLLKTDGSVWWLRFENGIANYYKRLGDGSDGVGNVPIPVSDIVDWQYNSLIDKNGNYWFISTGNVQGGWHNFGQLP